jgi:hypothetical protein
MKLSSRAKDITGLICGRLKVVKPHRRLNKQIYWECVCECGCITTNYTTGNLLKGTLRSCGCQMREGGKSHGNWRGVGDIPASFFTSIKGHAKHRDIPFDLDIQYLWDLFQSQNGKCALTGIDLSFPKTTDELHHGSWTASLDRIDSSKNYEQENVQWVHKQVNFMKHQLDQDRFFELCEMVVQHRREQCEF